MVRRRPDFPGQRDQQVGSLAEGRRDPISYRMAVLGRSDVPCGDGELYNSEPGGELLRSLGANGLSDIAASLDESRRQVIADLPLAYAGW